MLKGRLRFGGILLQRLLRSGNLRFATLKSNVMDQESTASNSATFSDDMSTAEMSAWLKKQGIPEQYCKVFEDNYIDGAEFAALSTDDIKAMVPPIGLANKISRLHPQGDFNSPPLRTERMLSPHSPPSPVSPSPLSPSQLSPGRTSYAGSVASSATRSVLSSKSKGIEILEARC